MPGCECGSCHSDGECFPKDHDSLDKWRKDFCSLRKQWSNYLNCGPPKQVSCGCCEPREPCPPCDPCASCDPCDPCQPCCSKLVKARFGLAWVTETPDSKCCSPCGWQLEICDTPSRVEHQCKKMQKWANCPPIRPTCGASMKRRNCCAGGNCCGGQQQKCCGGVKNDCCGGGERECCTKKPCCGIKVMPCEPKEDCCCAKIVPVFIVQGGDIHQKNGTSGESIYGENFEDENFSIPHDREGLVGMANNGPNTNNSQFYITLVPCSHLDNVNVVFGIVRKGFHIMNEMVEAGRENDTLKDVSRLLTFGKILLPKLIVIEDCGEFKRGEDWCIEENDGTDDNFPPWPHDWEIDQTRAEIIDDAINKIKSSGNYFFKKDNFVDAERKYVKVLRYIDWFISLNKSKQLNAIQKVRICTLLNLAAVRLKRNKYKSVVSVCNQVIANESESAKAFYRRGQARLALKDYDKALKDLEVASNLLPNDNNIRAVLKVARNKKLSYLQREKQLYGNLFK